MEAGWAPSGFFQRKRQSAMFVDFGAAEGVEEIMCDLCVVGSGPAGLAIAQRFLDTKTRVCVLESGGLEADDRTQALYDGRSIGHDYTILGSRLRFFGGSSNHWGGYCMPLVSADVDSKAWVRYSGWPVRVDELQPHFEAAGRFLHLGRSGFDPAEVSSDAGPYLQFGADSSLRTCLWRFSPLLVWSDEPGPLRQVLYPSLAQSATVTVWLNANLVDIETSADAGHVTGLAVRSLGGRRATVRARFVVLACGGIETPRLLLNCTGTQAEGLGNATGLVGRFFMEHPHFPGAELVADAGAFDAYGGFQPAEGRFALPGLALTIAGQRRLGCLGLGFTIHPADWPDGGDTPDGLAAWSGYCVSEQWPNPDSRVMLGAERDALGLRRAVLDWRVTEADRASAVAGLVEIGRHLGAAGLGRLRVLESLKAAAWPETVVGGNHHMGTTRMAEDPARGVVDPDCQVHGIDNLYVAGSSVFPTSGFANPTLTIVALADRLADHLLKRI